jgi:hypothetical protein
MSFAEKIAELNKTKSELVKLELEIESMREDIRENNTVPTLEEDEELCKRYIKDMKLIAVIFEEHIDDLTTQLALYPENQILGKSGISAISPDISVTARGIDLIELENKKTALILDLAKRLAVTEMISDYDVIARNGFAQQYLANDRRNQDLLFEVLDMEKYYTDSGMRFVEFTKYVINEHNTPKSIRELRELAGRMVDKIRR